MRPIRLFAASLFLVLLVAPAGAAIRTMTVDEMQQARGGYNNPGACVVQGKCNNLAPYQDEVGCETVPHTPTHPDEWGRDCTQEGAVCGQTLTAADDIVCEGGVPGDGCEPGPPGSPCSTRTFKFCIQATDALGEEFSCECVADPSTSNGTYSTCFPAA